MAYCQLLYHIVFRTHNSIPSIPEESEEKLYRYIWGYCKNKNAFLYRIGGMPDHIHMLVGIHQSQSVSDFVKGIKNASNKFIHENRNCFPMFTSWNNGYCALTYSLRDKDIIKQYIQNQKEHHKVKCFKDELDDILKEYGIEPDEYLMMNI